MEASRKKSNNFLVQGTILAAASIMVRLIGILYRIPLNNMIGDEGMGLYSRAFEIYNMLLILSSYSLPLAVSKLVAARMEKKEYRNAHRIFLCGMTFAVCVGMLAAGILYFGADFFSQAVFKNPRLAIPLRVLAPNILVFSIMGVLRGYFQGKNTMLPTAVSQIIEQIINAVISIVAAYYLMKAHSANENISAYGAAGGTLGTVSGAIAGLLFLLFIYYIYRPTLRRQLKRDRNAEIASYQNVYKLIILTIFPIILSQTVYQVSGVIDSALFDNIMQNKGVISTQRDQLMGIYLGKYKLLTNLPVSIASAMGVAIIPSIVAAMTRGSYREVKSKIHASTKFNMLIAIPSAVGMAVLAEPILRLLFYSSSTESTKIAASLLQVGSIAIIVYMLSTISNSVLQGIGKLKIPVYHAAIALFVHVITVYVLLKFTDASLYAMVVGNIVFALVVCISNWIYIARTLHYRQEIIYTFIMPGIASLIMGVVAFFTYQGVKLLVNSNAISTMVAIFVAVIVYFMMLIIMRAINEEELRKMPLGKHMVSIFKKLHLLR